ncbi:Bax inhibitor-1/YccA family protein [Candidatus Babeliales bacterium]|nr:Bax inhibitor-1/YccA family protein [Candidatus Babeliales bacterium]MBP9843673.1 Bax inhibitor-1/YccA family protein [Candidatus Babeliales bacterium]
MNYNNHYVAMAEGFMSKVYGWMTAGLCVTAGVAYYLSPAVNPQLFQAIVGYSFVFLLAQLGLVMYFSFAWKSLSYTTLATLFVVYSGLMGISLAPIAYIYTGESIFQVFLIAAAMFGVMAVYGAVTKSDLSSMGNILFMGLIGLIIANFINMFWQNAQFDLVTSCIGVGLFALLTAYDVQKLRNFGSMALGSQEDMDKIALLGALTLYLDIINLFLYLLRLFGKKNNN